MDTRHLAAGYAVAAASLYEINIPFAKILLEHVPVSMMAAFLYIGAGVGMLGWRMFSCRSGMHCKGEPLTRKDMPYTLAMVVLDIAAPILLMLGIAGTNSANVSLLNNFEIVATSLIALVLFKEVISRRLWTAILLVTCASAILTFEGADAFVFNAGSIFVLGACLCWGLENNCTKELSGKSSENIVIIKGCFSGLGCLGIGLATGEHLPALSWAAVAACLGFVSYGLSINFYIMAQKHLGAAKTSAYYSLAPFLGVFFSIIFLGERPSLLFYAALALMVISTVLMVRDSISLLHAHEHEHRHTHEHCHGDLVHTHEHSHVHTHQHIHENQAEELHDHHEELHGHDHSHFQTA
ncbi:MAG: EamA family transporter [Mailhella sp.]|nr:EamA family transporter [Mailhella sp.]